MSLMDGIKWNPSGLVPVVVQDASGGEVLMVAWANAEALGLTLKTGLAHFYSRSRKKLWKKGETSGHVLRVRELRLDCDGDTVLLKVDPAGPACHEGYRSCFFRRLDPPSEEGEVKMVEERLFDPKDVYKKK